VRIRGKSHIFTLVHAESPQKSAFSAIAHGQQAQESLISSVIRVSPVDSIRRDPMAEAAQPTVPLKHLAAGLAAASRKAAFCTTQEFMASV
jgi:hypothetical protein